MLLPARRRRRRSSSSSRRGGREGEREEGRREEREKRRGESHSPKRAGGAFGSKNSRYSTNFPQNLPRPPCNRQCPPVPREPGSAPPPAAPAQYPFGPLGPTGAEIARFRHNVAGSCTVWPIYVTTRPRHLRSCKWSHLVSAVSFPPAKAPSCIPLLYAGSAPIKQNYMSLSHSR